MRNKVVQVEIISYQWLSQWSLPEQSLQLVGPSFPSQAECRLLGWNHFQGCCRLAAQI